MRQKTLMLDLAQCEVFNHLPPMKAGVLIKAVMSYCTTGEVSPWGEDVDLKPIFMTFRATLEEHSRRRIEAGRLGGLAKAGKCSNATNATNQESERESEGEGKKRSKRKVEEGKGKVKEREKEVTLKERNETQKTNKQTELFEPETAHTEAKEPAFKKPSLAEVADYPPLRSNGP